MRSLDLLRSTVARDLGVVIGAHVGETSVLTRAALTLASAVDGKLLAQEGAFGTHLLTYDVVDPPLMFGAGGAIDATAAGLAGRPGFGLNITADLRGALAPAVSRNHTALTDPADDGHGA